MTKLRDALIDRNGDGVADDIGVRMVLDLPDGRAPRQFWSNLFDLMARLGLEAGALPFPLVVCASDADQLPDDVQKFVIHSIDDLAQRGRADPTPDASEQHLENGTSEHISHCLADLFAIDGALADENGDLLPDASRIGLDIPAELSANVGASLANLCARIGLESGGVTLPLVSERGRQFLVRPESGAAELTIDGDGWVAHGNESDLALLLDRVASEWPHITIPEAGGVHSSIERLARAVAGHEEAGTQPGELLWELQWAGEWELPRLLRAFRERLARRLDPAHPVRITAFLSEPRGIRMRAERSLRQEAGRLGFEVEEVRVLCAFKAGLSWMREVVIPQAQALDARSLVVEYRRFELDDDGTPALDLPIRWLQELFPADEIAARELNIQVDAVSFVERVGDGPTYIARALDNDGGELGSWSCDLLSVARPFVSRFPDEGSVTVTTGGLIAEQGHENQVEVVETDLERFWDFWQRDVLPRVMRLAEATGVRADQQPFFGRLDVVVTVSEPNERLGVREENDSAAEALHEDIYFNTLDTLEVLGLRTSGEKTSAPGAVVPMVRVEPGLPPHAWVRLYAAPRRPSPEIPDVNVDAIRLEGESLLPVVRVHGHDLGGSDILRAARRLHYGLDSIRALVRVGSEELPLDLPLPERLSGGPPLDSAPPMDELINGPGALDLAGRLASVPEVAAWVEDWSFEGRPIPAMAVRVPVPGRLAPPLKAAILKPTALIVARHHANEISSTNAAFQLAYQCATGPEWSRLLNQLNIVVIPFENADGAALHERLVADPDAADWKHHPARYNALGFEFSEDFHNPATRFGESRVRPAIWRRWLPDVLVDNHGVSSHEWVQPFAGFGSPPRFKVSYWIPQALIYGIIRAVDDERYPEHARAADALRKAVSEAAADTNLAGWNATYYRSYRTWAQEREPDRFPGELHDGMLWHLSTGPVGPAERSFAARYLRTTVLSWVTEVNDETASGEHLKRVASAHLVANRAMLDLIASRAPETAYSVAEDSDGRRTFRRGRHRPLDLGAAED